MFAQYLYVAAYHYVLLAITLIEHRVHLHLLVKGERVHDDALNQVRRTSLTLHAYGVMTNLGGALHNVLA